MGRPQGLPQIINGKGSDIYSVWSDSRRGFGLIYFFLFQGMAEKNWSSNRPIDVDFREGGQGQA